QHGADVNRLAVIAAVIFSELLHAENFTQRRQNANKFYSFVQFSESRRKCVVNDWLHGRGLGATPKPARGTRSLSGRMMPPPRPFFPTENERIHFLRVHLGEFVV